MRKLICPTAAAMLAVTGTSAVSAPHGFKGANLAPQAKVTLAAARKTALSAHPGIITDQELEREKGGSGLRYSFDIRSHGKAFEVGVDARSGKILENAIEGRNPD